jgi:hypothetical protein
MPSLTGRYRLVVAVILFGWACSDAPTTPTGPHAGLNIQAERMLVDTVTAPPVVVHVLVRDESNQPVSGAIVTFTRRYMVPVGEVFSLSSTSSDFPAGAAKDTSDADGDAAVRLWRGIRPGTGYLYVEARFQADTAIVLQDSVLLTTEAGLPAGFAISPRDTALYDGGSASIIAGPVDRFENPLPGAVHLAAGTDGITVEGNTVHAAAGPSRQVVRVTYETLVDSAMISIVPRGVIAVRSMRHTGPDSGFVFALLALDGSDYRFLLPSTDPRAFSASDPQWGHDGQYLLFSGNSPLSLYRMAMDGSIAPIPVDPVVKYYFRPKETADGAWMFFEGAPEDLLERHIYRARSDGSQLLRILPEMSTPRHYGGFPSPSPDGSQMAYSTDQEKDEWGNTTVQLLDIPSGTVRSLGVGGTRPSWSPTGEWIAFGDGAQLYVIHPDGTGLRQISADGEGYQPWTSWSPDGKWLVTEHYGPYIELIEVATGLRLPLMFTGYLGAPAWRPN